MNGEVTGRIRHLWSRLWRNAHGRVRAGWRLAGFGLCWLGCLLAALPVLSRWMSPHSHSVVSLMLNAAALTLPTVAATTIVLTLTLALLAARGGSFGGRLLCDPETGIDTGDVRNHAGE